MKAVVLAAGEGQRLRPLTLTRPKHLIPVGGKPFLEHLLAALREAGVSEILLVVNYKAEKIKEHLGDGTKFGVKINYALQKELRGTADAISTAESYVRNDFLVVNGDILLTSNVIKSALDIHKENKAAATLAAVLVEQPEHYGVFKLKGNRVAELVEKPSPEAAAGNPINAGVYVFSKGIFDVIRRTGVSPRGEQEITDSIRLLIEEGETVVAAKIPSGEWLDIGKPWDLLDANMRVLRQMKSETLGSIEENTHLEGQVFIGEGARIRSGSYIEGPAFIGEGSDIGPNCFIRPYTSIGKKARIGNACEVKNSIIMDGAHIAHLSYLGDSIIGEGCNLGAGSISANLRFDSGPIKMRIREDFVDSGKEKIGVIIGDNVKSGIGVLFMPGVKIGCNSWIGPGTVVYSDVPSDTILTLKQQTVQRKR
jgi:bifunctional UDP-N-acetylglucosamine pyrophosphorylase/glucosamine-1-phosphate N-acetyltransferase